MNPITVRRATAIGLLAVLLITASAVPAVAVVQSTPDAPASTTNATVAEDNCDPEDPPELAQARLHTREDTIEEGSPGVISGGFLPEAGIDCPIVVRIALSVPNNMYIEGTTGIGTGGAGIVAGEFTINPDAEDVKSVRADVYSTQTGEHAVTADIEWWPEGHSDLKRSITGLTLTFDVIEPAEPGETPTATPEPGETPDSDDDSGLLSLTELLAIAIVGLTLVGVVAAYTKGLDTLNIGVSK